MIDVKTLIGKKRLGYMSPKLEDAQQAWNTVDATSKGCLTNIFPENREENTYSTVAVFVLAPPGRLLMLRVGGKEFRIWYNSFTIAT